MTLRVLRYFRERNVIVCALPSNLSGKTQPCDTSIFGVFKQEMNHAISAAAYANLARSIDIFEFCASIKHAIHNSFTRNIITSTF